jgi:hypothetical protein
LPEIAEERSLTSLGKVGHYEQLSSYVRQENKAADVEFTIFEDSIDNIAEIASATAKRPNQPTFYYINGDSNETTKCYQLNEKDTSHFTELKSKNTTDIGTNPANKYFRELPNKKNDYLELEVALNKYITMKEREIKLNPNPLPFIKDNDAKKIEAAKKLIQAIKPDAGKGEKPPNFNRDDIKALREERLGKIIGQYESQLPDIFKQAEKQVQFARNNP